MMEIKTLKVSGIYESITGMRNPKNSWSLSDSIIFDRCDPTREMVDHRFIDEVKNSNDVLLGEKDLKLAQNLIKAGNEHMKFMRMIQVWCDMKMTRFFWSEYDTYKFNTKNSCSTMHKLLNPKNEITLDMFDYYKEDEDVVKPVVDRLNKIREEFLNTKDFEEQSYLKRRAKCLLFEGFLQLRTVNTNFVEIGNIVLHGNKHQIKKDW